MDGQEQLDADNIHFQPGVNEDLAATAVWGTQQVNLFPGATVDGVFGIWYGKGPGVDRSGDALQHANTAGTSPHRRRARARGDDHGGASRRRRTRASCISSRRHADPVPVERPGDLDFGLHGIAMSRFSGCWIGSSCDHRHRRDGARRCRSTPSASVVVPADRARRRAGCTSAHESPHGDGARLFDHKLPAVLAYARANGIDRIELDAPGARFGIVTAGKT